MVLLLARGADRRVVSEHQGRLTPAAGLAFELQVGFERPRSFHENGPLLIGDRG